MDDTRFSALIFPLPSLISTISEPGHFNFHRHRRQDTKDSLPVSQDEGSNSMKDSWNKKSC